MKPLVQRLLDFLRFLRRKSVLGDECCLDQRQRTPEYSVNLFAPVCHVSRQSDFLEEYATGAGRSNEGTEGSSQPNSVASNRAVPKLELTRELNREPPGQRSGNGPRLSGRLGLLRLRSRHRLGRSRSHYLLLSEPAAGRPPFGNSGLAAAKRNGFRQRHSITDMRARGIFFGGWAFFLGASRVPRKSKEVRHLV